MTREQATACYIAASLIMREDGDRDHMNRSRLNCEQTQEIAKFLRLLADEDGHTDPDIR